VLGHPIAEPETVATAIRIGHPATWEPALAAARESGGAIRAVTDDEIMAAYRQIARLEGVFCEPASAAGVALLKQAAAAGDVPGGTQCVCVLTGNGMKDPERAVAGVAEPESIGASVAELAAALGW
jgi:threonine synthase